jgi:TRAP-type C4-dicarboxylate transport system permease small subunit
MRHRLSDIIVNGIDRLAERASQVAACALLGLTLLIFASVLMRYIMHNPILSADDIASYLQGFIVCMGLAYALKSGTHVCTTVLVQHLSENIKQKLELPIYCIGALFTLVWTISMWRLAVVDYVRGVKAFSTSLELPLWIPESIVAIGFTIFLLLMISYLRRSIER